MVSVAIAAALGARTALVERRLLGGDCLNFGCVPSKAVMRAARAWHEASHARERFGGPEASGDGDFGAVMERMRRLRAEISEHDSAARFRGLGADVFLGDARFTGDDTVEVEGAVLRFRRAVIATGARPATPPIPGLEEAKPLTNENVFSLTSLPRRLAVIGAGPVGCELAQAFARFGSRVTVFDAAERILDNDDPEAAGLVSRSLQADGVEFILSAEVRAVELKGGLRRLRWAVKGEEHSLEAEEVLVATGRVPNVEGMGLEDAGVEYSRETGVKTDDRLQTSNRRVYAVGDVSSRLQFTHAADAQARLAVPNALFFGRGKASDLVIPWCTYTSPELAHAGIRPWRDGEKGSDALTVPLSEIDRARLDGEEEGFLRVYLKKGSDQVLGATLVAEHAGEVIPQLVTAMTAGVGLESLGKTVFPYPTQAEAVRKAADVLKRRKLTPLAKKALGLALKLPR